MEFWKHNDLSVYVFKFLDELDYCSMPNMTCVLHLPIGVATDHLLDVIG